ncbi:MAG: LuxR C-terminal-related transcriptional regulator [Eggerthellaceae bacterium]|nr:LuxR C-terminal-related transcriptional regulator [Eggerthellaceae bacterium]
MLLHLLKPNVGLIGYALFLAVNATGIWGGVFPFLPMSIQTHEIMFWFYLSQSVSLFITLFILARATYRIHRPATTTLVLIASFVYALGWSFLIAAMYLHGSELSLSIAGGIALGAGSAQFYLLWQQLFAASEPEEGTHELVAGFAYSALIYFALYLLPHAVTAYLIPLVFVPLFALALILSNRRIDFNQPMFEDKPWEHVRVYRRFVISSWRSMLAVGAIALCAGVVRSIAIERPEIGTVVNVLSMFALFVVALLVLFLWRINGLRLNIIKLYRIVFPLLILAFAALPFANLAYTRFLAAALFALYSIGLMLAMMQCAQISRDNGIAPIFAFGLFGGTVYAMHDVGFLVGTASDSVSAQGFPVLFITALLAVSILALMFFFSSIDFKSSRAQLICGDIELIAPVETAIDLGNKREEPTERAREGRTEQETASRRPSNGLRDSENPGAFNDRLSLKVSAVQQACGLSDRETEVTDYVVRGYTVARIAEELYVSENTVRTHMKRIYAKCDVHKKQELIDLVEAH